jgi:hypothetical protein
MAVRTMSLFLGAVSLAFGLAGASLSGTVSALAAKSERADRPIVQTADGPIAGLYAHGAAEFLGVPYAAPPVGQLRWKPPQPPAKWTETLLTIDFRDICVQNQAGQFAHPSITEDCLYLNVYAPRNFAEKAEARPVMVWFYGGGRRCRREQRLRRRQIGAPGRCDRRHGQLPRRLSGFLRQSGAGQGRS